MNFKDIQLFSDQTLLELLKSDRKKAFDIIYHKYWERIFVYTAKIIKDEEAAQDIIQEIFVSFWSRAEDLHIDNLQSYLYTAARYKAINYIKENIYKNNYEESLSHHFSQASASLEQNLDAKELAKFIDEQLAVLPEKMKEIYVLSRKEMLSHKEIAEKLNISDKTVKKQIGNAIKIFRLKLTKLYFIGFLFKLLAYLSTTKGVL